MSTQTVMQAPRSDPPLWEPLGSAGKFKMAHVGVIIPTYNPGRNWQVLCKALEQQGIRRSQILVIDSSSPDGTPHLVQQAGYRLVTIPKENFRHGQTRQLASDHLPHAEVLLYLTQDAVPAAGAFHELCAAFQDQRVGAAFGRQLPRQQAGAIERHARVFNYPPTSDVRTLASRDRLGIKAAFLSNSFAAYRRSALQEVGGFPTEVIMAEDTLVAAKLLMAGWKVAYQAQATVIHSHSLSLRKEFGRYFDTGVYHAREKWLLDQFGRAGDEGRRFVLSELRYLCAASPLAIPLALLRTATKMLAYHLGRREQHVPRGMKELVSGHPQFWRNELQKG